MDSSLDRTIHNTWEPLHFQTEPNVGTRSTYGPKSLGWRELHTNEQNHILKWKDMYEPVSLSPWQSLLMINKGNFLYSVIYFKCQSSRHTPRAAPLVLGSVSSCKKWSTGWRKLSGAQLCHALAMWCWPWHVLYLSFYFHLKNRSIKAHSEGHWKDETKLNMWKCLVKPTLKGAPSFQLSKFPTLT